jgi:hypothetical protein
MQMLEYRSLDNHFKYRKHRTFAKYKLLAYEVSWNCMVMILKTISPSQSRKLMANKSSLQERCSVIIKKSMFVVISYKLVMSVLHRGEYLAGADCCLSFSLNRKYSRNLGDFRRRKR